MPRILTNNQYLPIPIYQAIKNDTYEMYGDISVTTLIDAPHLRLLRKNNLYEEDASDMIWSLQGQALHTVIERAGKRFLNEDNKNIYSEFINEQKLQLVFNGKILSGTFDLAERMYEVKNGITSNIKNILHDYKNIFVYAAKMGEEGFSFDKWTKQTNIYKAMIEHGTVVKDGKDTGEKLGFTIDEIFIHGFLRDFSKSKSFYEKDYPQAGVQTYPIKVYSSSSMLKYIESRMTYHFDCEDKYNSLTEYDMCSEEDRWSKPETWKMMKPGAKKSLKNFEIKSKEDEHAALKWWGEKLPTVMGLEIKKVPGIDTRCVMYCSVKAFCKFYNKKYVEEKANISGGLDEAISGSEDTQEKFDF